MAESTPKTATKTNNLAEALATVQLNLPAIKKDKRANYGMYASLDAVHAAVLPLLSKVGLAWVTKPGEDGAGNLHLEYELRHTSGESITGSMPLLVTAKSMQQLGSAITYARRYAIAAVVGVTPDEDDDGNDAQKQTYARRAAPKAEIKLADEEPIKAESLGLLTNALKLKGYTSKDRALAILNGMAESFNVGSVRDLTEAQGQMLLRQIGAPATTQETLDKMFPDEPF